MTRTYKIRGSQQQAITTLHTTPDIEITSHRRLLAGIGREAGVGEIDVAGDEVVRVELENGFVFWTRSDDLIRERGRKTVGRDGGEGWEVDLQPPKILGKVSARGTRGWLGLSIRVLEFFGINIKENIAAGLGTKLEDKLLRGNTPGLYRCSLGDTFKLTPVFNGDELPAEQNPILIFIHGTASCCQGSFGKLWEGSAGAAARETMRTRYGNRVYAFEHRSLTVSPIENALDLVIYLTKILSGNTQVHLVSHSRGGLVGELLCLGERDKRGSSDDPLQTEFLEKLFTSDRTIAEHIGLSPLHPQAATERDEAYKADHKRLRELIKELDKSRIKVGRFVRVACPARGTTLASGRLDRWLSVINYLTGNGLIGDTADFLLAVVKERTDPRILPGLEAMMPGSALTRLLQTPTLITASDLSVISGDIEGDSLWSQIKLLATDWFYGADHDLVVNTGSMFGGIRRPDKGSRFLRDQGPQVCHFNYFSNDKSIRWLVSGLTRADDSNGGFQPIQAARQEEPKWRGAVRRSRSISTPRPLVVVLPGTMGSAIQAGEDVIWLKYLSLFRGGLGRLRKGQPDIRPTDLLDDFYGPLLEFLARSHRVETFPYDWRLSVRDAAGKLADKLENWLPAIERERQSVHLVAHSMGGLVVRAMIADGGRGTAVWRRILDLPNSRFMMMGTPNLGSHEAVRWLTGHNPTEAKLSLLDIAHSNNEIIDIVNCFPGLLELLPFDIDSPHYDQPSLWVDLKQQLSAKWKPAGTEALVQARATWDFLKQAKADPERMIYVAGCQESTVVGYQLVEYEEPWLSGRKRIEFIATREGDGTVAWRSGLLPEVKTWYVEDTAHDELCTQKRAFPGILDLLMTGTTTRLPCAPPTRTRDAKGEPTRFILPPQATTDDIPDEASLRGFGFGISRPFDEEAAGSGVPVIQLSLVHGNLAYARNPVLVGHHIGDAIISAEYALNRRLGNALTSRLQLGLYPERLGSHTIFFQDKANASPGGAVVIGLGQVGELSPALLTKSVRDAMLDYALRIAQWPDDRFGPADRVRSAALSCLLVGAGSLSAGMTVRDSIESILHGAIAANRKLVDAALEGKVVIDNLEFIELYEDVAITAAEALDDVLKDDQLAMEVTWTTGIIEEGQGSLSRVRCDENPGWWQRLEIIEDENSDTLRFIATTDRARAEETLATGQLLLAEGFIRQASQSASANTEVAKTLFEMLLPNRLKELAPKEADLILLVDPVSARYPWELLQDRWSQGNRPPAVSAGLIRQLKTPNYRPHPVHASEATAFVVGNPNLMGWEKFGDLPGARHEAQTVANLLSDKGYMTLDCIDEKEDAILSGLHKKAWRILHLAGHGEHEFLLEGEYSASPEKTKPATVKAVSGMVIGKNTFLTPGDVEQMRWVPELVFINCCHLGKTISTTARQGRMGLLAANLAVQFINMGVRAVVAAGWAVDDSAGEAFAISFYTQLFAGRNFGEAVQAAREEIWVRFPEMNTWGAYQCYGNPSYRLRGNGDDTYGHRVKGYHAPIELVADVRNYTEWIRMQVHEKGQDFAELDNLRSGIVEKLKCIPEKCRADWLSRGDVAATLGFAWGETCDWGEAVNWLEKALVAKTGDCPVRAVEQCANFRVRLSGQRWAELRATDKNAGTEAERQNLILEIERAIQELDLINQRAPTPERLNLLGSACKRLAWVHNDTPNRLEALVNMANYYWQAFKQAKEPDPYLYVNWAVAKVLACKLDSFQSGDWQATFEDDCRKMIEIARERNQKKPNFWDGVAEADCELVLLLAAGEVTAEETYATSSRIAELYRSAAQRGASPREYSSVREYLEFVLDLNSGITNNEQLSQTLNALLAKL